MMTWHLLRLMLEHRIENRFQLIRNNMLLSKICSWCHLVNKDLWPQILGMGPLFCRIINISFCGTVIDILVPIVNLIGPVVMSKHVLIGGRKKKRRLFRLLNKNMAAAAWHAPHAYWYVASWGLSVGIPHSTGEICLWHHLANNNL